MVLRENIYRVYIIKNILLRGDDDDSLSLRSKDKQRQTRAITKP